MKVSGPLLILSMAFLGYASRGVHRDLQNSAQVDFGRDVRPILSEHCFKCHGPDAKKAAAGLHLDSFAGATVKLRDGHPIVPGNVSASLLLQRVSDPDKEFRMPPADSGMTALTPSQIEILRKWIAKGAKYERHWSFVPPVMPKIPSVKQASWPLNPIDRFVLAKLEDANLKPEPEADKDTLAVRAAQTLTGLPPTPTELDRFRKDTKPGAYERYVDRLIASPAYSEHEARYWLDAVRYGDTHGLQLDNERSVYPYRDWVIQAFNDDLAFNKFVQWQLAGDLLPNPTTEQLVATGYVRMNLTSNEGGAIPEEFLARNTFDRVDTTSTVLLGLTVGCAKCHDHKYDPIKQKDYYGLYAYFDSTQDQPLDGNISLPPPFIPAPNPEQAQEMKTDDQGMNRLLSTVDTVKAASWLSEHYDSGITASDWQISPVYMSKDFDTAFDAPWPGEPGQAAATWKPLNYELGTDAINIIRKDNASVYVKGTFHAREMRTVTLKVKSDDAIRMWLNGKLIHSHKIGRGLADGFDLVKATFIAGDNELISKVINGVSTDGLNIQVGDDNSQKAIRALAIWQKAPSSASAKRDIGETYLMVCPSSPEAEAYRKLAKQRADAEASVPMTLIAREMAKPRPTFILKRGQYDQPGDRVERHIPGALGSLPSSLPNDRLGLATWLTDPSNPLVARVFVNRIWQQHFGTGIVKTVDDFGSQGEWPMNQPLLDYLAVSFVKNGWSTKKLNRMIVTSATFRQSSRISKAKLAKDPENRLLSRGPRFRLDAEVIRDKALLAGGLLVQKIGGHGFKPYQPDGLWEGSSDPASSTHVYVRDKGMDVYRRSMYLFWKRTSPPPVMVTFDAPLRDTCTVRRSATNTPLQALALLNEPAFLEASRTMAARVVAGQRTDATRMMTAFDLTLGRPPRADEVSLLEKSLSRYRKMFSDDPAEAQRLLAVGDAPQRSEIPKPEQAAWMIVCSSLMNTDEFLTQH